MTTIAARIDESPRTPWIFDPDAWLEDTLCLSEGARGVWFDMLCFMKKAKYQGFFVDEQGRPMTDDDLAKKRRINPRRLQEYLREIRDRGMYSVDSRGWIYSRRILRELSNPTAPKTNTRIERWKQIQQNPPRELLDWIEWWNRLAGRGLVACKHLGPNEDICKGWSRVEKSRELRELLARKEELERAIENATFSLNWLSLPMLFGGKNQTGELKVRRLLEGRYGDSGKQSGTVQKLSGLAAFARRAGGH